MNGTPRQQRQALLKPKKNVIDVLNLNFISTPISINLTEKNIEIDEVLWHSLPFFWQTHELEAIFKIFSANQTSPTETIEETLKAY